MDDTVIRLPVNGNGTPQQLSNAGPADALLGEPAATTIFLEIQIKNKTTVTHLQFSQFPFTITWKCHYNVW